MLSNLRHDPASKRPDIKVIRSPDNQGVFSPNKPQGPRLEPSRYDPQRLRASPSVTFQPLRTSPRTGTSGFRRRPPTPSVKETFPDVMPPEPLHLETTLRKPSHLRDRLVTCGNLPPYQELTAVDREAQELGVMTATQEYLPSNLRVSKQRPADQSRDYHDLQKKLGFYRQEVVLYKKYHSAYVALRARVEELHEAQLGLSKGLADADQALREYWAEHREDGNEEEVIFSRPF